MDDSVLFLPGAPVADAVLADVGERVAAVRARGRTVGLGTILVGDDPASAGYVRKKHEACEAYGLLSHHAQIDAGDRAGLFSAIDRFNDDPTVDAYLIQNPTPGLDFNEALERVDP